MSKYNIEKLKEIHEHLENDAQDKLTEEDCLAYISHILGVPLETLEAKMCKIRGDDLLTSEGI